jgi:DNA-binding MarR family transcriptional regulator
MTLRPAAGVGVDTGTARAAPSLLYAVKQVELAVRAHLDELLRPAGITALQYTALTVLERRADLTTAELARNSFVTPQAMGDLVTALERRGLIERHHDPAHRRRLLISLTEAGHKLLAEFAEPVRGLEERMVADLDADERAAFARFLNRSRAALATQPAH